MNQSSNKLPTTSMERKEEVKHTPLPWDFTPDHTRQMISVHRVGFDPNSELGDETCCGLWGEFSDKEFANAKFIVESCNNIYSLQSQVDQLMKALKGIYGMAEDGYKLHVKNGSHQEFLSEDREALSIARDALQPKTEQL